MQYADPAGARVLSVVVKRERVGEASQVRRQPLPGAGGGGGELATVRFRQGATTWLPAYGDRPAADADADNAVRLGQLLAARA